MYSRKYVAKLTETEIRDFIKEHIVLLRDSQKYIVRSVKGGFGRCFTVGMKKEKWDENVKNQYLQGHFFISIAVYDYRCDVHLNESKCSSKAALDSDSLEYKWIAFMTKKFGEDYLKDFKELAEKMYTREKRRADYKLKKAISLTERIEKELSQ